MKKNQKHLAIIISGFTLIELLVIIGVISVLTAIILVAVNPSRQFSSARDTQRRADLYSITNAVYQFAAEHNGDLPDTDNDDSSSNFPSTATCIGTVSPCFDLSSATDEAGTEIVVPTYIAEIPRDPISGTAANTQYYIYQDANDRIVASASGELTDTIVVAR